MLKDRLVLNFPLMNVSAFKDTLGKLTDFGVVVTAKRIRCGTKLSTQMEHVSADRDPCGTISSKNAWLLNAI